jgi:hypothetical protein
VEPGVGALQSRNANLRPPACKRFASARPGVQNA